MTPISGTSVPSGSTLCISEAYFYAQIIAITDFSVWNSGHVKCCFSNPEKQRLPLKLVSLTPILCGAENFFKFFLFLVSKIKQPVQRLLRLRDVFCKIVYWSRTCSGKLKSVRHTEHIGDLDTWQGTRGTCAADLWTTQRCGPTTFWLLCAPLVLLALPLGRYVILNSGQRAFRRVNIDPSSSWLKWEYSRWSMWWCTRTLSQNHVPQFNHNPIATTLALPQHWHSHNPNLATTQT